MKQSLPEIRTSIFLIVVLIMQLGCATSDEVRLDTESQAAFQQSLADMRRTLSGDETQKLIVALMRIRMMGMTSATEMMASSDGGNVLTADKLGAVDGLTYREILMLAERSDVTGETLK